MEQPTRPRLADEYEAPSSYRYYHYSFFLPLFIIVFRIRDRSNTLDFIRSPESLQNVNLDLAAVCIISHTAFFNGLQSITPIDS